MWHYFPRGPLENRVLKTRFIIQKNFKNLPSPKHGFTSPDRIKSERESDQREGDQIRERQIVRSERERKRSRGLRDPGRANLGARPGSCDPGARSGLRNLGARPGFISSSLSFFFFFSF